MLRDYEGRHDGPMKYIVPLETAGDIARRGCWSCDANSIDPMPRLIERGEREEAVAHALFNSTQNNGRLVNFHELLAMISHTNPLPRARRAERGRPMDDFVNPDKSGGAGFAKNDDAAVDLSRAVTAGGAVDVARDRSRERQDRGEDRENTDGVRSFVAKHNGTRNLYYSLNPTRTRMGKKAAKTDIARIEFVPADLDPMHDEPPEDAKKRYLTEIGKFKKKPTAVIDSGNGLNVIFKLVKPIELPDP